jgi:hypothetical protein
MVVIRGVVHMRTVLATAIVTVISFMSLYLQHSFLISFAPSNTLESMARKSQLPFEVKEHIHRADKSVHAEPIAHNRRQRARILIGIFTSDFKGEWRYQKRFRDLFQLHPRVCSLADFTTFNADPSTCEINYTFVVGANPHGPTELVDGPRPMLVERPVVSHSTYNHPDMTLLNIRYVRGWEYTIICHL